MGNFIFDDFFGFSRCCSRFFRRELKPEVPKSRKSRELFLVTVLPPSSNVFWENTSLGTLSDDNGNYKLTISDSSKRLLFKYLGFRDKIIQFNNQSSINITMIEEENILDEVVVNKKQKTIQKRFDPTMLGLWAHSLVQNSTQMGENE